MAEKLNKASRHDLEKIEFWYPAPHGLPVPVKPKRGSTNVLEQIKSLDTNLVSCGRNIDLIRSGALWLYGFLDESHAIAQGIHTVEGAYWHGLMHRSEGDFSNSMYWFRRVGRHAIFPGLMDAVKSLRPSNASQQEVLKVFSPAAEWEPQWLVDLCEDGYRGRFNDLDLLQQIAAIEYNLLMRYCLETLDG
jgi:hypothetical protein